MKQKMILINIMVLLFSSHLFAIPLAELLKQYEIKLITGERTEEIDPQISNGFLYYSSNKEDSYDIYVKDLKTSSLKRITSDTNTETKPILNNDQDELYFTSTLTDINGDLTFSKADKYDNLGIENLFRQDGKQEAAGFLNDDILLYKNQLNNKTTYNLYSLKSKKNIFVKKYKIGVTAPNDDSPIIFYTEDGYNIKATLFDSKTLKSKKEFDITYNNEKIKQIAISPNREYLVYGVKDGDKTALKRVKLQYYKNDSLSIINNNNILPPIYDLHSFSVDNKGALYFSAKKNKTEDYNIYYLRQEGFMPNYTDFSQYLTIAEYFFNQYQYAYENKGNSFLAKLLLYKTLYSYKKALQQLNSKNVDEITFAENYTPLEIKIAKTYQLLHKFKNAESIYRFLAFKNKDNKKLQEILKFEQISLANKRKKIDFTKDGYETSDVLDKLIKIGDNSLNNQISIRSNLEISRIFYLQKKYPEALIFAENAKNSFNINIDNELYAQTLFWYYLCKSKESNINKFKYLLEEALKHTPSLELSNKIVKAYFFDFFKDIENSSIIIDKSILLSKNKKIKKLLDSYALPELSIIASYLKETLFYYQEDYDLALLKSAEIQKIYRNNLNNDFCKQISALAYEFKIKILQHKNKFEESEGVLRLALKEYQGFNYDLFTLKFKKILQTQNEEIAEQFFKNKKYEYSLKKFKEAYELAPTVHLLRRIISCYYNLGIIDNCTEYIENKVKQREDLYNYGLAFKYLIDLNKNNIDVVNLDDAIKRLKRALEFNNKESYYYLTLSFAYESRYQLENQLKLAKENRNFMIKSFNYILSPFKFLTSLLTSSKGFKIDYLEQAISYSTKGLSVTDSLTNKKLWQKLTLNLANNYYNYGEYGHKEAIYYYSKVLESSYKFSSILQKALIFERIGHCYFTLENHDNCEKYYNLALKLYEKINDRNSFLRTNLRKGLLYLTSKDEDGDLIYGAMAEDIYIKMLKFLAAENNNKQIDLLKRNLAYAYIIDLEPKNSNKEINQFLKEKNTPKLLKQNKSDDFIYLNLFGFDLPIWKINLTLGSKNAEGFSNQEEIELIYSLKINNELNLKKYPQAIKLLKEKLVAYQNNENMDGILLLYNYLGQALYLSGDYLTANHIFKKGYKLAIKENILQAKQSHLKNGFKSMILAFDKNKDIDDLNFWLECGNSYPNKDVNNLFKSEIFIYSGILNYKKAIYLQNSKENSLAKILKNSILQLTSLNDCENNFLKADSLLKKEKDSSLKKKLGISIDYNLAFFNLNYKNKKSAQLYLNKANKIIKYSNKEKSFWKISYLLGKKTELNGNTNLALTTYLKAETILSEIIPEVDDYEHYQIWKKEIRNLYDRIIDIYYHNGEKDKVVEFIERYKSRWLLNKYSSRYLNLKDQLSNIHLKKIRDNKREISKLKINIVKLQEKDKKKFAKEIAKDEKRVKSYLKELKLIDKQIKDDENTRLLQLVSIPDLTLDKIKLKKEQALVSYHLLEDSILITLYAKNKIIKQLKTIYDANDLPKSYLNPIKSDLKEYSQIYICPDFLDSNLLNHSFTELFAKEINSSFRGILSLNYLKILQENKNINNQDLIYLSSDSSLDELLESDKPLYFDKKLTISATHNGLDNYFKFKNKIISIKDLLSYRISNSATFLPKMTDNFKSEDLILLLNSLNFAGVSQVLIPYNKENLQDNQDYLKQYGLSSVNSKFNYWGDFELNLKKQQDFAKKNLKQKIFRGNRYYTKQRYRLAYLNYRSALNMAEKIKDTKSAFKIKELMANCLKKSHKYYKSALLYQELADNSSKNIKSKLKYNLKAASSYLRADSLKLSVKLTKQNIKDVVNKKNKASKKTIISTVRNNSLILSLAYQKQKQYSLSNTERKKYLFYSGLLKNKTKLTLNKKIFTKAKALKKVADGIIFIINNLYLDAKHKDALKILSELEKTYNFQSKIKGSVKYNYLRLSALINFKAGRYLEAENIFNENLDNNITKLQKAQIWQDLVDLNIKNSKFKIASDYLTSVDSYLKKHKNIKLSQRYHNSKALYFFNINSLKQAEAEASRTLELYLQSDDKYNEAVARTNSAKIQLKAGKIEDAKINIIKALKLGEENSNFSAVTAALFYQGQIYHDKKDSSLVFHYKSLKSSLKSGDKDFEIRNYLQLANLYSNNLDSCKTYLIKALNQSLIYDLRVNFKLAAVKLLKYNLADTNLISKILIYLKSEICYLTDFTYSTENNQLTQKIYNLVSEKMLLGNKFEKTLNLQKELCELLTINNNIENLKSIIPEYLEVRNKYKIKYFSLLSNLQQQQKVNFTDSLISWYNSYEKNIAKNNFAKSAKIDINLSPQSYNLQEFRQKLENNELNSIVFQGKNNLHSVFITKNNLVYFTSNINSNELKEKVKDYYQKLLLKEETAKTQKDLAQDIFNEKGVLFLKDFAIKKTNTTSYPLFTIASSDEFWQNFLYETLIFDNKPLITYYNFVIENKLFTTSLKNNEASYKQVYSYAGSSSAEAQELVYVFYEQNILKSIYGENLKSFTKEKVLESTFKKQVLDDNHHSLWHLALHAQGKTSQNESYILFTPERKSDNHLTYSEILTYDFNNDDLLLSSCETGFDLNNFINNKKQDTQSSNFLANAFLLSRANSVIASRWRVSDLNSGVFIKRYLRYLKWYNNKIKAFNEAKRALYLWQNNKPCFWAGFGYYR